MYALNFKTIASQDLYQMCLQGEESAWHYLYNYVHRIIVQKGWRTSEEAEDMTQNVICHLLNGAIDKVQKKEAFKSFVRMVTINKLRDDVKKKQIQTTSYDNEEGALRMEMLEDETPGAAPEDNSIASSTRRLILRALEQLPGNCKAVLLKYIDYQMGIIRTYKELAKFFGEPVGTISSRINRCLGRLKCRHDIKYLL